MRRQYVQLSTDFGTALEVGRRRGSPVVLTIDADRMYQDAFDFFISVNGVWLTASVPMSYIASGAAASEC